MRRQELEEGKVYHNGKDSKRRLIQIGHMLTDGTTLITYPYGARFEQLTGRNSGEVRVVTMDSFAKWAKGVEA